MNVRQARRTRCIAFVIVKEHHLFHCQMHTIGERSRSTRRPDQYAARQIERNNGRLSSTRLCAPIIGGQINQLPTIESSTLRKVSRTLFSNHDTDSLNAECYIYSELERVKETHGLLGMSESTRIRSTTITWHDIARGRQTWFAAIRQGHARPKRLLTPAGVRYHITIHNNSTRI